jgi:alcohol dehydrogenase (cytochrome c)
VNWANGIGPDGRPQLPPPSKDSNTPDAGCPGDATNWSAPAYNPVTRLYYFMTLEECQSGDSLGVLKGFDRPEEAGQKYMRAVSIDTGEIVWEIPQIGPVFAKNWPGVLATAGGIVVFGDPNGALVAVNDQAGRALWHFSTNVHMKASPMTYMTNGKQFIAIAAGSNILCFGLGS